MRLPLPATCRRRRAAAAALLHCGLQAAAAPVGGEDVFPWAKAGRLPSAEAALEAFARGCPGNITGAGYSDIYGHFAPLTRDSELLYGGRLSRDVLLTLVARGMDHNRHLLACPFAVLKALQLWTLIKIHEVSHATSNPPEWDSHWHEIRHVMKVWGRLDKLVECFDCTEVWHSRVQIGLIPFGGADGSHWIWAAVRKEFKDLRAPQKQHQWTGNFAAEEHASFFRDSAEMLQEMRARGLLQEWVVTHGTMVTAMRYGSNRALKLPSGHTEKDGGRTFDMDVYVLTETWERLCTTMTSYAKERFGFSWCGWVAGWPRKSMQCFRGEAELELHNVDKRDGEEGIQLPIHPITTSMVPPSRCLGAPGGLELPCPREPKIFMEYLWRKRAHYTACLALPMSRRREADPITEEDVRFLWEKALSLHKQGFMSMAPYFGSCREHPLADYAQSLYWKYWEWT